MWEFLVMLQGLKVPEDYFVDLNLAVQTVNPEILLCKPTLHPGTSGFRV